MGAVEGRHESTKTSANIRSIRTSPTSSTVCSLRGKLLATQDTPNRQIILITDGLPTAHFENEWLYMLYPPDPQTEAATMREALLCQRDNITINMFCVPSWSQSEEDIRFAHRMTAATQGRAIFTAGRDLDRFVIWDYVSQKREILG